MSTDLVLPALPFGGGEATVLRWLRRPGEPLAAGEPLLIAANGRVEVVLPAPAAGTLAEVLLPEGASAPPGATLARLEAPRRLRITPLARRVAQALGLQPHSLAGSGPGGLVMRRDLPGDDRRPTTNDQGPALPDGGRRTEDEIEVGAGLPAIQESTDAPSLHRSIALPFTPSPPHPLTPSPPHLLTAVEVDLGAVLAWCAGRPAGRGGVAATPLACVAQEAVAALLRFPLLNAAWRDEGIVVRRRVHLAVRRGDGAALSIPDAQDLNLRGLARRLAGPPPGGGPPQATFTLAESAGWAAAALPAPGQSALLSLGEICKRPAVVGAGGSERVAVRPIGLLSLAYDARVLDQPLADAYLAALRAGLEQFAG
jgi:pyruvate/2-oxoglutarate dehydrogenase complex dihydrolipoamide acyltransferase (E2) component